MEKNIYENRFQDQIAIVTGGASGIGKEIALRLGREGAYVFLLDNNLRKLEETSNDFIRYGIRLAIHNVDITNEIQVKDTFNKIFTEYNRIDILVHSAGIVGVTNTKIENFKYDDFQNICKVNLHGSFLVSKFAVQNMMENNYGRILLISSIAGKEGNPGMVGYSASKAGMLGLIKGVAKEYADCGITINGLAPAVVKTSMNSNTDPKQLEYMTAKIPMKRLGTTDEVASTACYIVSNENSFTTGFVYDLSGGRATY